jgi:hypothetical protein
LNVSKKTSMWSIEKGFNNPFHLFVDSDDNIAVADCNNHLVQVVSKNGDLVALIGEENALVAPTGLCLDADGRLIVCEQQGFRITVY